MESIGEVYPSSGMHKFFFAQIKISILVNMNRHFNSNIIESMVSQALFHQGLRDSTNIFSQFDSKCETEPHIEVPNFSQDITPTPQVWAQHIVLDEINNTANENFVFLIYKVIESNIYSKTS